jgi:hypothetical protein
VLLLLVQYAVTCHTITITKNMISNTVKPLSIFSEGTIKNKQMRENGTCGKVICFKLFGENGMKIMTIGQIFLLNCELSRF